jgi:phage terminase small subunit
MPNPGKSPELKKKLGSRNAGLDPVMAVQHLTQIPEPLRRLEESGLQFWNNAFKQGSTWLKETDLELLQVVCEQLDERDILRVFVLENIEAWHERAALRTLEKDLSDNLKELGFTPTARQKLGIAEVKAQSKLDELMQRKANRVASSMVDPSSE